MRKIRKNLILKFKISSLKEFQFQEYWETCHYKKLKNRFLKDLIMSQNSCKLLLVLKEITEVTK